MTYPISTARISEAPSSIYYIPDFISSTEEQMLIDKVLTAPRPKWVQLKNRRLQNWVFSLSDIHVGCTRDLRTCDGEHSCGVVSCQGMIAEPLPAWLTCLNTRFREAGVFDGLHPALRDPNHCLVNEYLAGQGILPHKDGPAYLPTVATVSLSSHCVLEFYRPQESLDTMETSVSSSPTITASGSNGSLATQHGLGFQGREPEFSILVQPRSLVVLKEDVYSNYLHGIREVTVDDLSRGNILNLSQALDRGIKSRLDQECDQGLSQEIDIKEAAKPTELERGARISLTFRIVQKTMSSKRFFRR